MLSLQAVNRVLGNCSEFYEEQTRRLLDLGVDARSRAVSHVAYRTETLPEYLDIRRQLEPWCSANVENVWGGRPISKLLLQTPLDLAPNSFTRLVELIPPPHPDVYQRVYKLGLEHLGIVLGEIFAEFGKAYAHVLTGQQDQGPFNRPYFIAFSDHTAVKFYQRSLQDVCILEGRRFDGFYHVIE